jgi:hypothetical protein
MAQTTSCAFLPDGRTVVVELRNCALLADLSGTCSDLSPVAAAVYVAGVEELVVQGGSPLPDSVEVGRVFIEGDPSGFCIWVVDLAAGSSVLVPVDAAVAHVAVGVGRWLADAIEGAS